MFKVKIYTVGKARERWLQEAIAEYEMRLTAKCAVEWILAKNDADLMEKCSGEPKLIALDPKGELMSSEEWSKKLFGKLGSRPAFVIGGPEGIPKALLEKSSLKFSLSPLTFTHQMARLILLEQIYRAFEIDSGSSYHK